MNLIESHGLLVPLTVGGIFHGQLRRAGRVIDEWEDRNLVTNEGLNHILNVEFNGATQITSWFLGLFEGNYTPTSGLTAATVASTATETTAYASATRPAYSPASSTAQSVTNSASRASFVFTGAKTIYGAFLVSASTKSGTSGTLFAAARFGTSKAVDVNDELLLTYSFSASSS